MGWAGPAQPTGPDSAPKVLGRFRPKMDWADLGPKNNILFWARPGPEYRAGPDSAQKARLGQDPPGPDQNGRGELISPHPCMQNAIRSACREGKTNKSQNRGEEELPGTEVVAALVLLVLLEAVLVLVLLEAEGVPSSSLVLRFLSLSFSPLSSSSLVFFPSLSFVLSLPSLSSVFFLVFPSVCSLPPPFSSPFFSLSLSVLGLYL